MTHSCPQFNKSKIIVYYDGSDDYISAPDDVPGHYLIDCDCGALEDKINFCPFCGAKLQD